MKYIGKFNIIKEDGSVTYTELDVFRGEVIKIENVSYIILRIIESAYHTGGATIRTTEKPYPISFLSVFKGTYDPIGDDNEIDLPALATILTNFGITLVY